VGGTHTARPVTVMSVRPGAEIGRVVLTLVGGGALVIGAFLKWTRDVIGTDLTNRSLVQMQFTARTDIVATVGGIAIAIGLLAVVGLVDRTGWITRLAGALGIVTFALVAVEVYRSAQHTLQAGAWLALGGAVVLLIGGMLGPREIAETPTVVHHQDARR
jgi:hypothetical protein